MTMEKITYRSRVGDLEIPAFVFKPLQIGPAKSHPALVWVHENIRGHLYEHYIPYIRQATAKGYVVIAPEYRGSIGYGQALYDAIDYGGAEVDDVVTAASMVAIRYPMVDPARIGIIGWSHGGMIALLSVFRNPGTFRPPSRSSRSPTCFSGWLSRASRSTGRYRPATTGSAGPRPNGRASTGIARRSFRWTSCGFLCACTSRTTIRT